MAYTEGEPQNLASTKKGILIKKRKEKKKTLSGNNLVDEKNSDEIMEKM